jgi:hypothetical protein
LNVSRIIAGDTLQFTTSVEGYPASAGWVLTYRLGPVVSGAAITMTATASGDDYAVSVAASATAAWTAGEYTWYATLALGAARYSLAEGRITIKPNPATLTVGTDARSHAKRMLLAVEAVLEGRATKDQQAYTVGDISITRIPVEQLISLRDTYRAELAAQKRTERLRAGGAVSTKLMVRL